MEEGWRWLSSVSWENVVMAVESAVVVVMAVEVNSQILQLLL